MYFKLLLSFAYIGTFSFGGGYAMLPMFQRELVEKNKWLTEAEMTDLFSISQCLPGIIAANAAVFVGYKHKGIAGGVVAALGVALPSILFTFVIAAFFTSFSEIPIVQSAFTGLRICVSVMIINAVLKLRKHAIIDLPAALIFITVFILSIYVLLPVAVLVALAAVCGVAVTMIRKRITPDDTPPDDDSSDGGVK